MNSLEFAYLANEYWNHNNIIMDIHDDITDKSEHEVTKIAKEWLDDMWNFINISIEDEKVIEDVLLRGRWYDVLQKKKIRLKLLLLADDFDEEILAETEAALETDICTIVDTNKEKDFWKEVYLCKRDLLITKTLTNVKNGFIEIVEDIKNSDLIRIRMDDWDQFIDFSFQHEASLCWNNPDIIAIIKQMTKLEKVIAEMYEDDVDYYIHIIKGIVKGWSWKKLQQEHSQIHAFFPNMFAKIRRKMSSNKKEMIK